VRFLCSYKSNEGSKVPCYKVCLWFSGEKASAAATSAAATSATTTTSSETAVETAGTVVGVLVIVAIIIFVAVRRYKKKVSKNI
jgi:hypothetical protein